MSVEIIANMRLPVPLSPEAERAPSAASASSMTTDDRAERLHDREHLLKVPLGTPHPLAPQILEHHSGDAEASGEAGGGERLSRSDDAAEQIAHGKGVEAAAPEELHVLLEALFHRALGHHHVEPVPRRHELHQPQALLLDQRLFRASQARED